MPCWLASEETEAQGDEADPVLTAERLETRFRQHCPSVSFSLLELALGRVIPPFSLALFECAAEWKEHLSSLVKILLIEMISNPQNRSVPSAMSI